MNCHIVKQHAKALLRLESSTLGKKCMLVCYKILDLKDAILKVDNVQTAFHRKIGDYLFILFIG